MSRKFGGTRNLVETNARRSRRVTAPCGLSVTSRGDLVHNDHVINHTQIAHICVIDAHARAGFDPCLNDISCLVHNVSAPVENITARVIRVILPNNECFARLITGSCAFRNHRSDDRSGYLHRFRRSCSLFFIRRIRLGECQRPNQHTAECDKYLFYVRLLLLMIFPAEEFSELVRFEQDPLRGFTTAQFLALTQSKAFR